MIIMFVVGAGSGDVVPYHFSRALRCNFTRFAAPLIRVLWPKTYITVQRSRTECSQCGRSVDPNMLETCSRIALFASNALQLTEPQRCISFTFTFTNRKLNVTLSLAIISFSVRPSHSHTAPGRFLLFFFL